MENSESANGNSTRVVFACALALGILADALVRVEGRPGLNVALFAVIGTVALWLISRRRALAVDAESRWLVAGAAGICLLLIWRDAEALAVFCLFAAIVFIGLAAGRAARAWATTAYIADVAVAAARTGLLIALGPFGWSLGKTRAVAPARPRELPLVRTVARGTVMALPPLVVLTLLLASADPVFQHLVQYTFVDSLGPALEHALFAGVIAWLASGYLRAYLVPDNNVMSRVQLPRPAFSASEIAIATTLLDVLFVLFMIVQVRYLFGGAELVQVTEGLSYAEYARRGFFELVAATALVVPVLLVADWAAGDQEPRGRRALRATSAVLVLLLVGVLASAAFRMKLYQQAYGWTEDRIYGSAFMIWLALLLVWLAVTVLRAKRQRFVFGAVMAGAICLIGLHIVNPHALVARVNIDRAAAGAEIDGRYLRTLSADAVPVLIDRLAVLNDAERCRVTEMLKDKWSGERRGGWRTWNLSDAHARARVAQLAPVTCPAQPASSGN